MVAGGKLSLRKNVWFQEFFFCQKGGGACSGGEDGGRFTLKPANSKPQAGRRRICAYARRQRLRLLGHDWAKVWGPGASSVRVSLRVRVWGLGLGFRV